MTWNHLIVHSIISSMYTQAISSIGPRDRTTNILVIIGSDNSLPIQRRSIALNNADFLQINL